MLRILCISIQGHSVRSNQVKLNPWQLACILGSAMGLPAIAVGGRISDEHGAGTALVSIFIGNLILWLIGLGIVSMAPKKNDAIENIRRYLGTTTGIFVSIILGLAFLIWYAIQIKGAVFIDLLNDNVNGSKLWFGLALGIGIALLGVGGIRLIARVCVFALPILLGLAIYVVVTALYSVSFKETWGFSFMGTFLVMLTWLPGIVNLPTFFRHSKSKADSFFAISLMTVFHVLFQIFAVLAGIKSPSIIENYIYEINSLTYTILIVSFVLLLNSCINLVNIYFASAIWDALVPFYRGSKKYIIIGLLGTVIFLFLQSFVHFLKSPLYFFENIITGFISNLGIVLIIEYLISMIVRHRPRSYEKFWSSMCWLVGCLTIIILQAYAPTNQFFPLIAGINASLLSFLLVIFIEETIWSIKNLNRSK